MFVLFSGKRLSGKTHLSNELALKLSSIGHSVLKTSFSKSLKQDYCFANDIDFSTFEQIKEQHRESLTAFFETYNEKKFINDLIKTTNYDYIIVDDLRLQSHFDYFYKLKSNATKLPLLIRVNASSETLKDRGFITKQYDQHYCETRFRN